MPANVFGETNNHKEQSTPAFTLTLDRTKTYKCLFWAGNEATKIYDVASLKATQLQEGKESIESSFYGRQDVNGAVAQYNVTLYRAVAKIRLGEKDHIAAGSTLDVTYTPNAAFNVLDGSVTSGAETIKTINISTDIAGNADSPIEVGSFYLLAPTESSLKSFKFKLTHEGEVSKKEATNVPVQANYATFIRGEFSNFTEKAFTVTADDAWSEEKPEQSLLQLYVKTANTLTEEKIKGGNTRLIINGNIGDNDITALSTFAKANANAISVLDMGGCTSTATNIPNEAFRNINGLRSFVLPEGIETIGNYAFSNHALSLTSVKLPESLTTIGGMHSYMAI